MDRTLIAQLMFACERLNLAGLGVSYLHLLRLLKTREGENEEGYAVSDFT